MSVGATPDQAAQDTSDHRALRAHVAEFLSGLDPADLTFLDVCRAADGAFPADVRDVLPRAWRGLPMEPAEVPLTVRQPELSPVRAEWYYTPESVAALLPLLRGDILVVGGPTVAEAAAHAGVDTVLVDDSPWLDRRVDISGLRFVRDQFLAAELRTAFDTVLLDPPWYFPIMTDWLSRALGVVPIGGRVVVSLPGALTRPSAEADRAKLWKLAEPYGTLELLDKHVEYETPLYERIALAAAGVPLTGVWRRADLLVITKTAATPGVPRPVPRQPGEWLEFSVLNQTVSVRRSASGVGGDGSFRAVPGVDGFVLDTVSRRDARLRDVDIWTSRNRVAGLARPERTVAALAALNEVTDTRAAFAVADHGDGAEVRRVLDWLGIV